MRRRHDGRRSHHLLGVRCDPSIAAERRHRAARWSRRARAHGALAACAEMFRECAELIATVRAQLERAPTLDEATRAELYAVVREMLDIEQLGRVVMLAARLPQEFSDG